MPDGCAADPNNWNRNLYTLPPLGDTRWAQLFVLDRKGFTQPGKATTYPIRRFVNMYVTAADGFSCPGDDSAGLARRAQQALGSHDDVFARDPGATPSGIKCSFTDGGVCVPVLVK